METMFPIQTERGAAPHPRQVPWEVAELAYSVYAGRYGTSQTLTRLAQRGGFAPSEMDDYLPGWREQCELINIKQRRVVMPEILRYAMHKTEPRLVADADGAYVLWDDASTLIEAIDRRHCEVRDAIANDRDRSRKHRSQILQEIASEIRDLARHCGVARRPEDIRDELEKLAGKYLIWATEQLAAPDAT